MSHILHKVNLNSSVRIRLTEEGRKTLVDYCNKNSVNLDLLCVVDNNDYIFTLWELMHIFGQACYNGNVLFEDNNITVMQAL